MPRFSVQESHPGNRPVFIYSIVDDDLPSYLRAFAASQERGHFVTGDGYDRAELTIPEVIDTLRQGTPVTFTSWGYGRSSVVFRNTMRLAVEADTREAADALVMIEVPEIEEEQYEDYQESTVNEKTGDAPAVPTGPDPVSQMLLEKFKELIVARGLLDEASMSGSDVSVELESTNPLSFAFSLPRTVKHADIMSKPCEWADDFGADTGKVEFGSDGEYHATYIVCE